MAKMIKGLLPIVCLLVMMAPVPADSVTITIEAENFAVYQDLSLEMIRSVQGAACTGGYYLDGFDWRDEWVEYEFDVAAFGVYNILLRVRGDYNVQYLFEVTLTGHPSGETQTTYIPFTGLGYG